MRVEDLDGPRVKAASAEQILHELRWLGLDWEGPVVYQSARAERYRCALQKLAALGAAYPCACSRKDVEQAASAPNQGDVVATYPGTCRGKYASAEQAQALTGRPAAWRVMTDNSPIAVDDRFAGPSRFCLGELGGDFVIFKSDGLAAYQLAVVVDDAEFGVDAIVRGDDLLDSAARQMHLRKLLGLSPQPEYWHLPLVVGTDGRRLAKRHGDTRLSFYRNGGTSPQQILGLMGYWSGILPQRQDATMEELLAHFDLARVPRRQVVFTAEDDRFLRGV